MNLSGIAQALETINIRPDGIHDKQLSEAFRLLLQLIEELSENNEKLKAENQKLRDEISLMKGEHPKPDIKPSGKKPNVDISSEEERKPRNTPKNKKSKTKKPKIKIDRVEDTEEVCFQLFPEVARFFERFLANRAEISPDLDATKSFFTMLVVFIMIHPMPAFRTVW